ncbi:hypothetical protein PAXRUDRAFT_832328 [Paxillus rubicundulus Ve08.2h10]|uniref:Uncharacterized protein n=1 Tax=Paxillus rubicundulus Ve08.2h10 TaxID=930991 RepID=A0A0D0DKJ0_9AGAM|nr:hypothetical protein PAXRUDRAFT_832328 [Paxillus rubicundulus Ve08.2h10]
MIGTSGCRDVTMPEWPVPVVWTLPVPSDMIWYVCLPALYQVVVVTAWSWLYTS